MVSRISSINCFTQKTMVFPGLLFQIEKIGGLFSVSNFEKLHLNSGGSTPSDPEKNLHHVPTQKVDVIKPGAVFCRFVESPGLFGIRRVLLFILGLSGNADLFSRSRNFPKTILTVVEM